MTPGTQTDDATVERSRSVSTLTQIAAALQQSSKVLVATHENPDGDAIGSARSTELILQALEKDVQVYVPHGAVPKEYEFIRPDRLIDTIPDDIDQRVLICVDCGNRSRLANEQLIDSAAQVLNVDHHADNTHFGDLNVVRGDVACATQLVYELAGELGVEVTADIALPIYVGLVTDTGRFQYSNTTAEALLLAADLVRRGVDVHLIFREVFERLEYPRLKLLARGLEKAQRFDANRLIATHLTREDFDEIGADDDNSEGIVDFLRGVEDAYVAVFVRDLKDGSPKARKGSMRTTRDDVDVSIIARTWNGGGHRQAAGFSTDDSMDVIVERVSKALAEQMSAGQSS